MTMSDGRAKDGLSRRSFLRGSALTTAGPGLIEAASSIIGQAAVVLDLDQDQSCRRASIILGAAAPTPYRAKTAEAALVGKRIDETTAQEAAHAALDGARPLTMNAHKLPLFETLVRRTILQAAARQ